MSLGRNRIPILESPTPLQYLAGVSRDLGIELYMKRDDLTDPGSGGNKLRKLEYYLAEARSEGATALLTVGGAQTNHGRLTAGVAARFGFRCAIAAIDPWPGELSANLLLDRIFGAEVYLQEPESGRSYEDQLDSLVTTVRRRMEAQGERVSFIPMGGSGPVGLPGYYDCGLELAAQAEASGVPGLPSAKVFVSVGSMGTYMGLFAAIKNQPLDFTLEGNLIGPFYKDVTSAALSHYNRDRAYHNLPYAASRDDFVIHQDSVFGGYNNPVPEVREAICYLGRKEGILLDPCYTGKTFRALLDQVRSGKIRPGEKVIFLHTGGQPGLNGPGHRQAFEEELMDGIHILPSRK